MSNKVSLNRGSTAMWIVCEAIGKDYDKIDKMEIDRDDKLVAEIEFKVGGVELDFNRVVKGIEDNFDSAVKDIKKKLSADEFERRVEERAMEILKERYGSLIGDLSDMQERIESHKDKFRYTFEE